MSGDNGKLTPEPEKTPEQLASERLARYQANPESFIEKHEVIFCALRSSSSPIGLALMFGQCSRVELDTAYAELQYRIHQMIIQMQVMAEMNKAKIAKPGGIMDFVRRK